MFWRNTATRHDTVNVRMMRQRLAPGVQHHRRADLRAQAPLVGHDDFERLLLRLEQHRIDDGLVVIGDRRRQREHDVEVFDRQQIRLSGFQPAARRRPLTLRTVTIAASNGHSPLAALWAKTVMGSWQPLRLD